MDILDSMKESLEWAKTSKKRWEDLRRKAKRPGDVALAESMVDRMTNMITAYEAMIKQREEMLAQVTPWPSRKDDTKRGS